jgi:hypothetical protein
MAIGGRQREAHWGRRLVLCSNISRIETNDVAGISKPFPLIRSPLDQTLVARSPGSILLEPRMGPLGTLVPSNQ